MYFCKKKSIYHGKKYLLRFSMTKYLCLLSTTLVYSSGIPFPHPIVYPRTSIVFELGGFHTIVIESSAAQRRFFNENNCCCFCRTFILKYVINVPKKCLSASVENQFRTEKFLNREIYIFIFGPFFNLGILELCNQHIFLKIFDVDYLR